jgi:hypothetical protein
VIGSRRAWIGQFVKLVKLSQQQSSNQSIHQVSKQASKQASKQGSNFVQKKISLRDFNYGVVCNSETENMFDALCCLIIIFFMSNSSGD